MSDQHAEAFDRRQTLRSGALCESALGWTKDPPTVEGYYWISFRGFKEYGAPHPYHMFLDRFYSPTTGKQVTRWTVYFDDSVGGGENRPWANAVNEGHVRWSTPIACPPRPR